MLSLAVSSVLVISSPVPSAEAQDTPGVEQVQLPQSDNETSGEPEIVVEAPPALNERRNELRHMAQDVLEKPRFTQAVGTYSEPMSAKVFGLSEDAAKVIEGRMQANAVEFGLNHKNFPENCTHNTSVIFVPESQGTADTWFNYRSDALDHLLSYEKLRVLNEEDPVRAWRYRRETGVGPANVPNGPGNNRLAFTRATQKDFYASRPLREPNELGGAAVLIELPEANGKTLIQLADYASMRTFGNTKGIAPDAVPAAPTILTLFQDDEAVPELTSFDKSLLTMLYNTQTQASRTRFYGNIARSAARKEMKDGLIEGNP